MNVNRIRLLKTLDRWLGSLCIEFVSLFVKPEIESPQKVKSILIIRPGGLGDAVLLIPAIKVLKSILPRANIDILAEKRNHQIFRLCNAIRDVYCYDRGREIFQCLKNTYEIVIDTEQWHRLSAVVAYMTKSPVRAGFDTNEREKAFNVKVSYSHDEYEAISFLKLIRATLEHIEVGTDTKFLDFDHESPFIDLPDDKKLTKRAEELLKGIKGKYCVISPGATVLERRWGGDNYAVVAEELNKHNISVVIAGTMADREDALKIKQRAKYAEDLTGKTSLIELAYIMKGAELFIGPDSGLLHIAIGLGVPTVCLFGSGISRKWAPRGKAHRVINKNLPCSPCTRFGYTPSCKKAIACLKEITPQDVINEALNIIKDFSNSEY